MARVDELLRQEIGQILARDVQDPRIGFATVTAVETTPDLGHAKVRVSVIGGAPQRADTVLALEHAMGFIRRELGARLRLRRIPALHVVLDESAERGTRVMQILDELEQGHDAEGEALADAPLEESLPTPVARVRRDGDAEPEPTTDEDHQAATDRDSSAAEVPSGRRTATGPGRRAGGRQRGTTRGPGRPRGRPTGRGRSDT